MTQIITIRGYNPIPWSVGTLGVGRKGGKHFPTVAKAGPLSGFQQGVHEDLSEFFDGMDFPLYPKGTPLQVEFYLWRQLETIQVKGGRKRKAQRADATNCSKALEDALQKVVYHNDVDNVAPLPFMIEQTQETEPGIIIATRPWTGETPVRLLNYKLHRQRMLTDPAPITYTKEMP